MTSQVYHNVKLCAKSVTVRWISVNVGAFTVILILSKPDFEWSYLPPHHSTFEPTE